MTAIAGVARNGRLVMGGDSCVSWRGSHDTITQRKVAVVGPLLVGVCGDVRTLNVVLAQWQPPKQRKSQTDLQYVSGTIVNSLRKLLQTSGCLMREPSGEEAMGGELMIGYAGVLYCIDQSLGVTVSSTGEATIGSGADVARGALHATRAIEFDTERVKMALAAAEECSYGVRAPFTVLVKESRTRKVLEETV